MSVMWGLIIGGIIGAIGGIKMLMHVTPENLFLAFLHDRVVTVAHSWVTVVHELGHWFWGLPSSILSLRIIPKIYFTDSHNASISTAEFRGILGWIFNPIKSFGGYLSPVIFGAFFIYHGITDTADQTVPFVVLLIATIIMFLGARAWMTLVFAFFPLVLTVLVGYLNNSNQHETADAVFAMIGMIALIGGLGDIIAVNLWAITPRHMKLFFSTDFGIVAGWGSEEEGISPRGPFFAPHVALIVFDVLFVYILFVIHHALFDKVPVTSVEQFFSLLQLG